jgi:TolA-binding protein
MNDETSHLHGELGKALLSAGRDEWPSDEALSRTLAAIGAGAAVVTATGGAIAAAGASAGTAAKGSAVVVSFASVAKWLGMGALGGVVVAGVAHEITPASHAPLEPKTTVTAPAPKALGESNDRAPALKPQLEPIPVVAEPSDVTHREAAERGVPLAAEVALVDRARAALASGSASRALEELRTYESAFPEPRLLPEVLFLRMEAHLAAGNAARARETAEQSVRLFPRSPHAARAREVIDGRAEQKK